MNNDRFQSFTQSLDRFSDILKAEKNVANRDSAIKRFELTFELAWKTLKMHVGAQGIVCRSPRECLKEAFTLGIVRDNPLWVQMIQDRNASVHTYNEKLAEEIYGRLPDYQTLFLKLNEALAS